jgi:hypothetical protein
VKICGTNPLQETLSLSERASLADDKKKYLPGLDSGREKSRPHQDMGNVARYQRRQEKKPIPNGESASPASGTATEQSGPVGSSHIPSRQMANYETNPTGAPVGTAGCWHRNCLIALSKELSGRFGVAISRFSACWGASATPETYASLTIVGTEVFRPVPEDLGI